MLEVVGNKNDRFVTRESNPWSGILYLSEYKKVFRLSKIGALDCYYS